MRVQPQAAKVWRASFKLNPKGTSYWSKVERVEMPFFLMKGQIIPCALCLRWFEMFLGENDAKCAHYLNPVVMVLFSQEYFFRGHFCSVPGWGDFRVAPFMISRGFRVPGLCWLRATGLWCHSSYSNDNH